MILGIYISLFLLICDVPSAVAFNRSCEEYNETDCDYCIKNSSCLWCITGKTCLTVPPGMILPPSSLCSLNDARWGVCAINYQSLIITVAMLAAAILIAFFICLFWYCRCEKCRASTHERKLRWQTFKRTSVKEQRREEMRAKHSEIQQKHGLRKGSAYTKFDNNV